MSVEGIRRRRVRSGLRAVSYALGVIAFFSGVSLVVLALGYFIDHDKIADFVAFSIFVILLAAFLSGYANGDL